MSKFAVSIIIALIALFNFSVYSKKLNYKEISYKESQKAYYESYNFERNQNYKEAVKAMSPILDAAPNSYPVNLRLGWLNYLNKNYANSVYHYKKSISCAPNSIEAKLGCCYPLMAQNRYDEVETLCYRIIQTDHHNYYGNLNLAFVLRMQKKFKQAKNIAVEILESYPTDTKFLTELALNTYALGEKEKANSIFRKIIILEPSNTTANYYLGIK